MTLFSRSFVTSTALVIAAVCAWLAYDAHSDPRSVVEKFYYRFALVSTKADQLNDIINDGVNDSTFLASFIGRHLKANNAHLDDKQLDSPTLVELLKTYTETHLNNVIQVRLLDSKGFERIRFDTFGGIDITQITGDRLQDKSNRDYFKVSASSAKGLTTTSAIELNVENGVIEEPYRPTVRFTTPITINSKNIAHIVVNYDFQAILRKLTKEVPKGSRLILANKDGSWVNAPNFRDNWNRDLGNLEAKGLDQYSPTLFRDIQFSLPDEMHSATVDGKSLYMQNVRAPLTYNRGMSQDQINEASREFYVGVMFPTL